MPRVRVKVSPNPVRTIEPSELQNVQQAQPVQAVEPIPQPTEVPAQNRSATPKGLLITRRALVGSLAALLIVTTSVFLYSKRERPDNPSGTLGVSQTLPGATAEAQQYYDAINQYVELPSGEAPTVLNISDANEVKRDNAALSDINNGDKMLFFKKSRKLVVYRPSTKKVIAVVSLAAPAAVNQ